MNQARDGYVLIENVWKRFRRGEVHDSLRDLLPALSRRWARRPTRSGELSENEFWAVRDLSFEVQPGEALGIIGGNGAGKSTALKILTRILRPNHGTVEVRGRIGALIEISAGFHQDLTGRENIFLQGSIMGMPLALIRRRFDEIVEFSGIAEFLDTPVKRYSSGMQARLGFSIAVHLDPDDGAIDGPGAAGYVHTFERRASGRGGHHDALAVGDHDLTVGAEVDGGHGTWSVVECIVRQAGQRIRADKASDEGRQRYVGGSRERVAKQPGGPGLI